MQPLLPILVLTPLAGAAVIFCAWRNDADRARRFAILAASVALALSLALGWALGVSSNLSGPVQPRLLFAPAWLSLDLPIGPAGASVHWQLQLGLDGIGLWLVLLTTGITLATLVVASRLIDGRASDYVALLLLTESALLGAFLSMDLLLFYVFFEATLLPLVLLIVGWGRPDAWPAARKFLLFTLVGSIPMAVGLAGLAFTMADASGLAPTISIPQLAEAARDRADAVANDEFPHANVATTERWIFLLLFLGFGIKMAILPFHSWLPTTYLAAHPTTTAILAGVVLKLGLFGFLRICLPLVPEASSEIGFPLVGALGATAIVVFALAALAQRDLLSLLAYSSLSHVGFITLGLFSFTSEGISGAALQMVNHGLTTAALFLLAAIWIDQRRSASLEDGPLGLASIYPRMAVFFVFFLLAGAGLPGLNNFVGELLSLAGMLKRSVVLAALAATGVLLGAWYSIRLIQRMLFGVRTGDVSSQRPIIDLKQSEILVFASIGVACLAIGVRPLWAIDIMAKDLDGVASLYADESRPDETATLAATQITEGAAQEQRR